MNPVNNTSSLPLLTSPAVIENLEASSEAMKSEIHKKKSDKVEAEVLLKIGSGMGAPLSQSVTVTSYSLPIVSSPKTPDIEMAQQYLAGGSFSQAMEKALPTFTINMFARGYAFFVMVRDMNIAARSQVNQAGSALMTMRESINTGLKAQIIAKGKEAMAMGITGAAVGFAVSAVGSASLVKNSTTSRNDLKNTHKAVPKEEAAMRDNQMKINNLDLNNPADQKQAITLKSKISVQKENLDNMQFKSHLVQNRSESTHVKGMAVQAAGQSATSIFEGINQSTQAVNEAGIVGFNASQESLSELSQKTLDAAGEQRQALEEALNGMKEVAALQSDLYSAISGNLK